MMSSTQRPTYRTPDIVVGVDGSPVSANALRCARRLAALSGGTVDVVHVITDRAPMAYPIPFDDLAQAGRAALESTLRQAGEDGNAGMDAVVTHLERGGVVGTLVEAGRHAEAVVVGSDRRSLSMRFLTGNVSTGLAARSVVPVVSVPEAWDAGRTTGLVLVGVKHADHSDALMAEAFHVALRTGSKLLIVHAWRMPAAYDDIVASDPHALAAWRDRALGELEAVVAPWRKRHPGVDAEIRVMHDYPIHALVEHSEDADELIVERRAHGIPAAAHLGSTARAVLMHSSCPVRVVPAVHVPVLPGVGLEAPGASLRQPTA